MSGNRSSLCPVCLTLAVLTMGAGGLGMLLSFLHLGSPTLEYSLAGVAGFVAGSVFIASGPLSLTMLAIRDDEEREGRHFVRQSGPTGQAERGGVTAFRGVTSPNRPEV